MSADTIPESLNLEQWREVLLGVIRSVAHVAKNYDERGRSSMPITLDEAVALLYAANQHLAVTDAATIAAHDAEVARKERERIAEFLSTPGVLWHGDDGVTVYADGAFGGNRMKITDWLRAEQIGENRG